MGNGTAKVLASPTWEGSKTTKEELFAELQDARAARNVEMALDRIGVLRAAQLNKVVGQGYMWRAFGDNPSNVSSIGLASKPGKALVERITNAFDAVFERARPKGKKLPTSPREAAREWFNRPESGPDSGLFNWKYGDLDEAVTVHIRPSDAQFPTVDVTDKGIGLLPEEFPKTILSLQAGNKMSKLYLAGTFGQGGASSIAFSRYVIIWSRHKDWPTRTGFTVIRELELGSEYKENAYAYLTNEEGHILWVDSPADSEIGTTVRHVEYKLEKLDGTLISSPGNLYHYFNASMFDPFLPFRVIDHRDFKRDRNEVVSGARNRLMKVARGHEKETGSNMAHFKPMEYIMVGETMKEPTLGLEYWVVLSKRKSGLGDDRVLLRPQSNELFVMNNYPLVATVNGQVHGEISAKFLRDIGLPLVSKHMVIHLDASRVNTRLRRDLFATTREGFKEGPLLNEILEKVAEVLKADEKLFDLEQQLANNLISKETSHTTNEVKKQVVKLLSDAGWQGGTVGGGPRKVRGEGKEVERALSAEGSGGEGGEGSLSEGEPFVSAPFPEVSRFEPACDVLEIPVGKTRVIRVDSDASREFADKGLVGLRAEPDCLEVLSFAAPKNGGFSWRVRPKAEEGCPVGTTMNVIATLTKPNGEQHKATILVGICEPEPEKTEEGQTIIPDFEIVAVSPKEDPETWMTVWPDLPPVEVGGMKAVSDEELGKVAYRTLKLGDSLFVYYSTAFTDFAEVMEKNANKSAVTSAFLQEYQVWVGYDSVLQYLTPPPVEDIDAALVEKLAEAERSRFAKVQVRQALRSASLRLAAEKAIKAAGAD
jgi:hypothetical protein